MPHPIDLATARPCAPSRLTALSCAAALAAVCVLFAAGIARAAQGDCAQPVSTGAKPTVTDCLAILRAAVGGDPCDPPCMCAPKGSLPTTAIDALLCLKAAVGQSVTLDCPCEPTTTTTTLPGAEIEEFPTACLTIRLRRGFNPPSTIRTTGRVELVVDHTTIGDRDHDGHDDVSITVFFFEFETLSPTFGDVTIELNDPAIHPSIDQTTHGIIEEGVNTTPGALDLPPFAESGSGIMAVNLFVQVLVDGPSAGGRAHHDFPLSLSGTIQSASPPPGDVLTMQNTNDVPLLKDSDGLFFNMWIESEEPATLELNPQSCE